jgi:DNA mismatch endonuclease (patch repair protein)
VPDIFTKAKRSAVMALIRASGNAATELRMIALFRAHGITGWRRKAHVFGKPDFVFRGARVAVFVDGCFWHGCPRHATQPRTRAAFWAAKFSRNKERDREVTRTLRRAGWTVLRVWECALTRRQWTGTARRLVRALGGGGPVRQARSSSAARGTSSAVHCSRSKSPA